MKVNKKKKLSKKQGLTFLSWCGVFFLILSLSSLLTPSPKKDRIGLSVLVSQINSGDVKKLTVIQKNISIDYKDGNKADALKETDLGLSQSLLNLGAKPKNLEKIEIEFQEETKISQWILPLILSLLPSILIFLLFLGIFRQAKVGASQAFDFTKAKAKLFGGNGKQKQSTTFSDVAGLKEAKEELREIIDFLKNPKKFFKMGAKIPRGVLLIGPPGTGKTMLARAVASEANVPFFSISGSEFIELFVGVGASRARSLFAQAKKAKRAIVFIDEIDSIGRTRGMGYGGGHEEREQTLNQLLAEMDGFERESEVIVIAATNRPGILDPALLRPGRFDRRIVLDMPDIEDREKILKIHSKTKLLSEDIDLREIAERTPGFSGADLENLANEAAILATRKNKNQIYQEDFLQSIEKVLLGPERQSHILSKKEKEITAFHEAGHAIVSTFVDKGEQVRKVSIIARGLVAGYTLKVPKEEKKLKTKSDFLADLAILFGGYVAEKIKFNEVTTGAANDLSRASRLARKLVKEYGMSRLGPLTFGEKQNFAFLNINSAERKNYSEETSRRIDNEVAGLIKQAEQKAESILKTKRQTLEKLAKILIKKETIEKQEFQKIIEEDEKIRRA